jgi:large subunit ribosomal protein L17
MRHRLKHRKLNRNSAARKALLRGLATQLIEQKSIVTTIERAKELRKIVEPLVALARVDNMNNRRIAAAQLYTPASMKSLFSNIGPANASRSGGYTRIMKLGFRPGDHARRAIIEFVEQSATPVATTEVNPTV